MSSLGVDVVHNALMDGMYKDFQKLGADVLKNDPKLKKEMSSVLHGLQFGVQKMTGIKDSTDFQHELISFYNKVHFLCTKAVDVCKKNGNFADASLFETIGEKCIALKSDTFTASNFESNKNLTETLESMTGALAKSFGINLIDKANKPIIFSPLRDKAAHHEDKDSSNKQNPRPR